MTNRSLRQHFPKGSDASVLPWQRLNPVVRQLSERPGNAPGSEFPGERFDQCVSSVD
ncbi:hypothetical protein BN1183_AV_00290 [Pantoea ananatis]|nr:hypothetical protein BN1183_AV_00290 [Pantoea ananatis]